MGRKVIEHDQLALPRVKLTAPRHRDKNDQWRGGARAGAGRPKRKRGPGVPEPHSKRRRVLKSELALRIRSSYPPEWDG